jgi:hypothetical protein
MMALWSPEAVARAATLDPDPAGFIRAAAELIAGRLLRAGMSPADARGWGETLAAEAAAYLEAAGQRRATA